MVEMKNGKKILTTPIISRGFRRISKLAISYILNGSMTTCRDVAHRRLVEEGQRTSCGCKKYCDFPRRSNHPSIRE